MGYYDDHIIAVGKRWRQKRKESELSSAEFEAYTRKTMKEYGWNETEINRIVKIAMKD